MYKLRTISIKTQVRRLKYFGAFLEVLSEGGLPKTILEQKILKWSSNYKDDFQRYKSSTGEIIRKESKIKSQSFQNYYQSAIKLNLINEVSNYVKPSRIGFVLKTLKKVSQLKYEISNVYDLDYTECIFFIYTILLHDADFLLTVLQMVNDQPGKVLEFYIENFQKYYNSRLKKKVRYLSGPEQTKAIDALNRVMNWRSPKRYCEDLVPPRLNWMLDLNFISDESYIKYKKYELNDLGQRFYCNLPSKDSQIKDIGNSWFKIKLSHLLSCLHDSHEVRIWDDLSSEEKEKAIMESLYHAGKYFSPINIPRLSVSQTFLFITLFLLSQKKIVVEFQDISGWIGFEKIVNNKKIGLRKAARPEESYIVISNSWRRL